MDGPYIIIFVTLVSLYHLIRIVKHSKEKGPPEENVIQGWKQIAIYFKWGGIVLCCVAIAMVIFRILSLAKLEGGALAQADLDIFLTFLFWVLPTNLLVLLAVMSHIKFDCGRSYVYLSSWLQPYIVCAFLIIAFSFILLIGILSGGFLPWRY